MRVLLVNPYYPITEIPSPPLGLAFLAGALEQAGVEVRVLDLVVFPHTRKRIDEALGDFVPDLVGVTSVTMTFYDAVRVLEDVRRFAPDVPTVMGGPHVTFAARESLEAVPSLDAVVLGEGEETLVALARAIDAGRSWEHIPGLVYRDGQTVRATAPRTRLSDLNALARPARHLLPMGRYHALGLVVGMTTSRGCPERCIFCVGRKMGGPGVRFRDPAEVADEFGELAGLGFHQINVVDDQFTTKREHCLAVCQEIIDRGIKSSWTSFARVDTVSPEIFQKMHEAGCIMISFGVESANAEILKTIRKRITVDQVRRAVTLCGEAGIAPQVSFILGLPGETPETIEESANLARELHQLGVSPGFHLLAPFPGTEVRERAEALGIKILTNDWSAYHANRAVVETPTVSRQRTDDFIMAFENLHVLRLNNIRKQMEQGSASPLEAWMVERLRHTEIIYELMMSETLEKEAAWPAGADEGVKTLAEQLRETSRYSLSELENTLGFAAGQGNLRRIEENGRVRWAWRDYL
jgi:radical SAM superfamily enzyme YgiQ (UPF0313 family)